MIDRIVNAAVPDEEPQEVAIEVTLRPHDFTNYIGQERLKQNIQLAIAAATDAQNRPQFSQVDIPVLNKRNITGIIGNQLG